MKKRNFVSLTIAFAFIAISVTGLCLYFALKSEVIETVHVLFGLIFTAVAIFHIWYNFPSLRNYSRNRKFPGLKKELIITFSCCTVLLILMSLGVPFMENLSEAGRSLAGNGKRHEEHEQGIVFSEISTNEKVKGTSLCLIIRKKREVLAPIMAIWIEDSLRKPGVESLFVPAKMQDISPAPSSLQNHENPRIRKQLPTSDLNTAMLPEFFRRNPDHAPNYLEPTPVNSFILETNTRSTGSFKIFLEIRYRDKTELYYSVISPSTSNIFLLQPLSKSELLRIGIVKINF